MRLLLLAALSVLLAACVSTRTPWTGNAPSAPAAVPASSPITGGVYIRLFDGVLALPPGYVLEGNDIGEKVLFQGPTGTVRIGSRDELKTGYMDYVRATLKAKELRCGLEILRHGTDTPPLWLLLDKQHYALAFDQDAQRVPAILDAYCATLRTAPATP